MVLRDCVITACVMLVAVMGSSLAPSRARLPPSRGPHAAVHGRWTLEHPEFGYRPPLPRVLLDRTKAVLGDESRLHKFVRKLLHSEHTVARVLAFIIRPRSPACITARRAVYQHRLCLHDSCNVPAALLIRMLVHWHHCDPCL